MCICEVAHFYLFTDKGGASFLMASKDLIEVVTGLENYISVSGITDKVIEVYCNACNNAIAEEKDIEYGLALTKRTKGLIEDFTALQMGQSLWDVEKYCHDKHVYPCHCTCKSITISYISCKHITFNLFNNFIIRERR